MHNFLHIEMGDVYCCGISELHGIEDVKDPKECLLGVCFNKYVNAEEQAFIVFSCRTTSKAGVSLAAYIKKHKLGSVVCPGRPARNPNSNNMLQVWLWRVNDKALRGWLNKNKTEEYKIEEKEALEYRYSYGLRW